jgi:hypothetical protein
MDEVGRALRRSAVCAALKACPNGPTGGGRVGSGAGLGAETGGGEAEFWINGLMSGSLISGKGRT